MFEFIERWTQQLEEAKPHIVNGVNHANYLACHMIDVLEDIRDILNEDESVSQYIISRPGLTAGNTPITIDVPPGSDWKITGIVTNPNGAAGDLIISSGGITRFAKSMGSVISTQSIDPEIVMQSGTQFSVQSFGAATVDLTLIVLITKPRPKYTKLSGDQNPLGDPGNQVDLVPNRHYTDEATDLSEKDPNQLAIPDELPEGTEEENVDPANPMVDLNQVPTIAVPYPPYDA